MAQVTISLPDPLVNFAKAHSDGGDVAEYLTELVRREQKREAARGELRQMLAEAATSPVSEQTAQQIWDEALAENSASNA